MPATAATHGHDPRCIENALVAIAENNYATIIDAHGGESDEVTPEIAAILTPETESEALEWLANGNVLCWWEGDYCSV